MQNYKIVTFENLKFIHIYLTGKKKHYANIIQKLLENFQKMLHKI